jgi:Bacterial regulatory proteins, tetR family
MSRYYSRAAVTADFSPAKDASAAPKPWERIVQGRPHQAGLSPDDRRREFVAKTTEFFSGQARRLRVTQPRLYRYFPSKDDLIKEVYRTACLEPFDTGWEKLLIDRAAAGPDYDFDISVLYQSPTSLAVINATPSWLMT